MARADAYIMSSVCIDAIISIADGQTNFQFYWTRNITVSLEYCRLMVEKCEDNKHENNCKEEFRWNWVWDWWLVILFFFMAKASLETIANGTNEMKVSNLGKFLIISRFTCPLSNKVYYSIPFVEPHPLTVNLLPVINPLLRPTMGKQIGLIYFEYETFVLRRSRAKSWCLSLNVSLYCGWMMIFSTPKSTTGSAHFWIRPVAVFDGMQSCFVSILYSPRRTPFLCPFKRLQMKFFCLFVCFYLFFFVFVFVFTLTNMPFAKCNFCDQFVPEQAKFNWFYMHSIPHCKLF